MLSSIVSLVLLVIVPHYRFKLAFDLLVFEIVTPRYLKILWQGLGLLHYFLHLSKYSVSEIFIVDPQFWYSSCNRLKMYESSLAAIMTWSSANNKVYIPIPLYIRFHSVEAHSRKILNNSSASVHPCLSPLLTEKLSVSFFPNLTTLLQCKYKWQHLVFAYCRYQRLHNSTEFFTARCVSY